MYHVVNGARRGLPHAPEFPVRLPRAIVLKGYYRMAGACRILSAHQPGCSVYFCISSAVMLVGSHAASESKSLVHGIVRLKIFVVSASLD